MKLMFLPNFSKNNYFTHKFVYLWISTERFIKSEHYLILARPTKLMRYFSGKEAQNIHYLLYSTVDALKEKEALFRKNSHMLERTKKLENTSIKKMFFSF